MNEVVFVCLYYIYYTTSIHRVYLACTFVDFHNKSITIVFSRRPITCMSSVICGSGKE